MATVTDSARIASMAKRRKTKTRIERSKKNIFYRTEYAKTSLF